MVVAVNNTTTNHYLMVIQMSERKPKVTQEAVNAVCNELAQDTQNFRR